MGVFCTVVPSKTKGWEIDTLHTAHPVEYVFIHPLTHLLSRASLDFPPKGDKSLTRYSLIGRAAMTAP